MRIILLAAAALIHAAPAYAPAHAQTAPQTAAPAEQPPTPAPTPDPADVSTVDGILAALYGSISGDAGVARDWDRFNGLFHPSARLIPTGVRPDGTSTLTALTPAGYIARAEPALMRGFHEREISRRTDAYGRIVQVFSTYESRHAATDAEPFARGINSIQLWNDGARWWVITVYWQAENPAYPLPETYLPRP